MKRDGKTPALGVPTVGPKTATDEEAEPESEADPHDIDPVFGIEAGDLHVFNVYWHEIAMLASEDPRPPSPDEVRRANDLYEFGRKVRSKSPDEVRAECGGARCPK